MAEATSTGAGQALVNHVAGWLMKQALRETDLEAIVIGCCERLFAASVPIVRGYFAFPVLHPLHAAIGITWLRGQGATLRGYAHVPGGVSEQFLRSPHYYMLERKLDVMRIRLEDGNAALNFSILDDLRQEGVTDYLAFAVNFKRDTHEGMLGSWATDRPGGFTDGEIESLLRVQERLAVACKLAIKGQLMRNIADTYLGHSTGARVLDGAIRRGDGEAIEAAIWYSDMRNSSIMADTMPPQVYIDSLNAFFDATGGAVTDAGGEILSFIGDSLLAIFATDGRGRDIHAAALKAKMAAQDAAGRMAELNTEREAAGSDPLGYGLALHIGEVMYGNVGIPERLTFSVFGAAVNEVARLETLTKELGEPILMSDRFAACVGGDARLLGTHSLRGIGRQIDVYALDGLSRPARMPRKAAAAAT